MKCVHSTSDAFHHSNMQHIHWPSQRQLSPAPASPPALAPDACIAATPTQVLHNDDIAYAFYGFPANSAASASAAAISPLPAHMLKPLATLHAMAPAHVRASTALSALADAGSMLAALANVPQATLLQAVQDLSGISEQLDKEGYFSAFTSRAPDALDLRLFHALRRFQCAHLYSEQYLEDAAAAAAGTSVGDESVPATCVLMALVMCCTQVDPNVRMHLVLATLQDMLARTMGKASLPDDTLVPLHVLRDAVLDMLAVMVSCSLLHTAALPQAVACLSSELEDTLIVKAVPLWYHVAVNQGAIQESGSPQAAGSPARPGPVPSGFAIPGNTSSHSGLAEAYTARLWHGSTISELGAGNPGALQDVVAVQAPPVYHIAWNTARDWLSQSVVLGMLLDVCAVTAERCATAWNTAHTLDSVMYLQGRHLSRADQVANQAALKYCATAVGLAADSHDGFGRGITVTPHEALQLHHVKQIAAAQPAGTSARSGTPPIGTARANASSAQVAPLQVDEASARDLLASTGGDVVEAARQLALYNTTQPWRESAQGLLEGAKVAGLAAQSRPAHAPSPSPSAGSAATLGDDGAPRSPLLGVSPVPGGARPSPGLRLWVKLRALVRMLLACSAFAEAGAHARAARADLDDALTTLQTAVARLVSGRYRTRSGMQRMYTAGKVLDRIACTGVLRQRTLSSCLAAAQAIRSSQDATSDKVVLEAAAWSQWRAALLQFLGKRRGGAGSALPQATAAGPPGQGLGGSAGRRTLVAHSRAAGAGFSSGVAPPAKLVTSSDELATPWILGLAVTTAAHLQSGSGGVTIAALCRPLQPELEAGKQPWVQPGQAHRGPAIAASSGAVYLLFTLALQAGALSWVTRTGGAVPPQATLRAQLALAVAEAAPRHTVTLLLPHGTAAPTTPLPAPVLSATLHGNGYVPQLPQLHSLPRVARQRVQPLLEEIPLAHDGLGARVSIAREELPRAHWAGLRSPTAAEGSCSESEDEVEQRAAQRGAAAGAPGPSPTGAASALSKLLAGSASLGASQRRFQRGNESGLRALLTTMSTNTSRSTMMNASQHAPVNAAALTVQLRQERWSTRQRLIALTQPEGSAAPTAAAMAALRLRSSSLHGSSTAAAASMLEVVRELAEDSQARKSRTKLPQRKGARRPDIAVSPAAVRQWQSTAVRLQSGVMALSHIRVVEKQARRAARREARVTAQRKRQASSASAAGSRPTSATYTSASQRSLRSADMVRVQSAAGSRADGVSVTLDLPTPQLGQSASQPAMSTTRTFRVAHPGRRAQGRQQRGPSPQPRQVLGTPGADLPRALHHAASTARMSTGPEQRPNHADREWWTAATHLRGRKLRDGGAPPLTLAHQSTAMAERKDAGALASLASVGARTPAAGDGATWPIREMPQSPPSPAAGGTLVSLESTSSQLSPGRKPADLRIDLDGPLPSCDEDEELVPALPQGVDGYQPGDIDMLLGTQQFDIGKLIWSSTPTPVTRKRNKQRSPMHIQLQHAEALASPTLLTTPSPASPGNDSALMPRRRAFRFDTPSQSVRGLGTAAARSSPGSMGSQECKSWDEDLASAATRSTRPAYGVAEPDTGSQVLQRAPSAALVQFSLVLSSCALPRGSWPVPARSLAAAAHGFTPDQVTAALPELDQALNPLDMLPGAAGRAGAAVAKAIASTGPAPSR